MMLLVVAVGVLPFARVRYGLDRLPGDIVVDWGGFVLICRLRPQSS
jgi:hypothetical protein